ncbi:29830_t:CDS:1, partial [Gigaspora margarita]
TTTEYTSIERAGGSTCQLKEYLFQDFKFESKFRRAFNVSGFKTPSILRAFGIYWIGVG